MLEMLEAMFFCNTIAKLASNMEITMLEVLEAASYCDFIEDRSLWASKLDTFTMSAMLETMFFGNLYRKTRL